MLIERDRELTAIDAALERGGAIVIAGSFGAGKSALVAAAAAAARARGAIVLSARAAEPEREYSGGLVGQLLNGADLGTELDRAIDELAGDRPVCVTVDDLHWADPESVQALRRAVDRRADLRLITALDPALAEDPGFAAGTVLRPLSPAGVAAMLERTFERPLTPELAAAFHAAAGGLPRLVSELVTELRARRRAPSTEALAEIVERPPRGLQRTVGRRLEPLPPACRRVASAAAVLGDAGDAATLARLAGLRPDALAPAIERLIAVGVLRSPATFTAPLVAGAVATGLPSSERSLLHARAAELLADAGAPAAVVAPHILRAPRHAVPDASATLAAAVTHAQARGEAAAALRYLQRAANESGGADAAILAALGSAQLRLGRVHEATSTLDRALSVVTEPDDRLRAAAELATAHIYEGRARAAAEVLTAVGRDGGSDAVHLVEATHAVAGWCDLEVFRAFRRSVPLMRDDPAAAGRLAAEHALHGTAADARRLASERLTGPADGGHLIAFRLRELALVLADDPSVLPALAEAEAAAGRSGSELARRIVRALEMGARLRRGELQDVARLARAQAGPFAAVHALECLLEQGRLDEADAALGSADGDSGGPLAFLRSLALGRLRARQGRAPDALAAFARCERLEASWGLTEPAHASWRAEAAAVHHGLGDASAARSLARHAVDRSRRYGSERLQGMALTTAGKVGAAGAVLEQAVALLDHAGAQLEGARARAELGSLLRRQGQARAARTPLLEAETVAHDVGAAPLLAFVRQELALTGAGRPVRRERDDLTPAERRTARLAADGLKNREIAAALQLAEKTVERQLSQVYRKLGIRSRRQLPQALG